MSTLERAFIAIAVIGTGTFLCLWREHRRNRRADRRYKRQDRHR